MSDEELAAIEKKLRNGDYIDMYGHHSSHDAITKLLAEVRRLKEELDDALHS